MKVYSNVTDPGKKKKSDGYPTYTPGKETKTYTSSRALTGDKRYGKEDPKNKDAAFIEEARKKKQDIAYKDGKPYRAGTTTVTKEEGRFTSPKIPIQKPGRVPLPTVKKEVVKKEVKATKKSAGKLKPMAMTYGTSKVSKGKETGGNKYKNKVRAIINH